MAGRKSVGMYLLIGFIIGALTMMVFMNKTNTSLSLSTLAGMLEQLMKGNI